MLEIGTSGLMSGEEKRVIVAPRSSSTLPNLGLSYGQALCSETKPIRGGPDWLIAFLAKRRCAPKAQITSGWKSHSRSCRYDWIADGPFRRVNRRDGSLVTKPT